MNVVDFMARLSQVKGGVSNNKFARFLRLDGYSKPAVALDSSETSLLLTVILHGDENLVMPPKQPKLPDAVIAGLERWIREGAYWPDEEATAPPVGAKDFCPRSGRRDCLGFGKCHAVRPLSGQTSWCVRCQKSEAAAGNAR